MESSPVRIAAVLLASLLLAYQGGCSTNVFHAQSDDSKDTPARAVNGFAERRQQMVDDQLRARGITDPLVLTAMLKVPRHLFVPQGIVNSAYEDTALPLTLGQTISQPFIVAYMTQALELKGGEKVLEIGTGSGYQAAVLSEIVKEVFTIEILPELAKHAEEVLAPLGYRNIHFRTGDGYLGWPEFAPFDAIIVTAAPDHVPQPLVDQLKRGGRMIIPLGRIDQKLLVIEKGDTGITRRSTIPVRFVPMTGKAMQGPPR
jgi:protein-L-isoaspartate(D-aspartate) O-methyltransferase